MVKYTVTFFPEDPETLYLVKKMFPTCVVRGLEVFLGNYPPNIVLDAICRINKFCPYIVFNVSCYDVMTRKELFYSQIIQGKVITRRAVRRY